ncbi:MAG: ABC transporter substrate-binding protein [Candidatus Rokubacteria bacterium]|nr:ABC transporter substrate-binding protein [Candidatus Rokubacteria bacterium]
MNTRAMAVAVLLLVAVVGTAERAGAQARDQMTWALHFSLAPTLFEPAETPGVVSPFMILYALHDALIKPMPGNNAAPSLAESWTVSPDGLVYEFVLRKGPRFHTGEPVTAEDVKFSFERYRGISAKMLKDRVAAVETPDAGRVRFRLKLPWADFLTFYGGIATGANWVVPKKYVERVGEEGFKKAPVGAGPYKFVSFTPGIELVVEATDTYWRKNPSVKRIVFKSVPDVATRLVALKSGDADGAYALPGELGEEVQRTAGLTLRPTPFTSTHWILFADQFDKSSPWHDRRVRLAATHAVDRQAINQAVSLGYSKITGSIIPTSFDFYWQPPPIPYDVAKAKQLLAEAGYPKGFDAGDLWCDISTTAQAEASINYLLAAGIKVKLRPVERAGFLKQYQEKKLKNLIFGLSGIGGNAATRIEAFTASTGTFAYGSYPDVDGLFRDQAGEMDRKKREALLHKIQQLMHDKVMYLPIWQLSVLNAFGPRVAESGLGLINGYPWAAPYEDVKLKAR